MDHEPRPTKDEIDHVFAVMKGESDRGCVLVGASLIEWQMGELLKAVFLDRHPYHSKKLKGQIEIMLNPFGEKSILGAAAPRARMCRALNLISEDTHELLKAFLVFRNEHFAHARREAKLSDDKIRADLEKLRAAVPEGFDFIIRSKEEARGIFTSIVVILYFLLDVRCQDDHTESQPSSS